VRNRSLCILLLALFVGEMASAQKQKQMREGRKKLCSSANTARR
jgi:hypothetical protein